MSAVSPGWFGLLFGFAFAVMGRRPIAPRKKRQTKTNKPAIEKRVNDEMEWKEAVKWVNWWNQLMNAAGPAMEWRKWTEHQAAPLRGKPINSLFFLLSRCARQKRRKELNGRESAHNVRMGQQLFQQPQSNPPSNQFSFLAKKRRNWFACVALLVSWKIL